MSGLFKRRGYKRTPEQVATDTRVDAIFEQARTDAHGVIVSLEYEAQAAVLECAANRLDREAMASMGEQCRDYERAAKVAREGAAEFRDKAKGLRDGC